MNSPISVIAFYLPQFHPISENSAWWGAGFTEWTNVARARPQFFGHHQPNIPADVGFYDLRLDETREQQAELAAWAGISAFCYYHYWFAGRLVLEKPMEMVLEKRMPDFPFCICWANHDWTRHWEGRSNEVLIKMTYPGEEDDRNHYQYLRRFFADDRYFTYEGKPLFVVFRPKDMKHPQKFVERLKNWAKRDGFNGLYIIAMDDDPSFLDMGYDALAPHTLNGAMQRYLTPRRKFFQKVRHLLLRYPNWVIPYEDILSCFDNGTCDGITHIPTVIPNWDNTPRIGRRGLVLTGSTPQLFKQHLQDSIKGFDLTSESTKLLLIKSWNEWAEGNYIEPDLRWGKQYLETLREWILSIEQSTNSPKLNVVGI